MYRVPLLLLAPMEGLVDDVMRSVLTRATSYDWCVTEFARVTDTVLPKRFFTRLAPELLNKGLTAGGVPVRVQLMGADPDSLAANADKLAELYPAGIDLNFGCPAPLVNRHGGGAVLLDDPALLYRIVSAVRAAIGGRVTLSAKMRLGVRDTGRAMEAAHALCDGGAELLVVHARTRDEGYRPPAHWHWVARIAEAVNVPVVANGEVWSVADYLRCRAESGVASVMLGRGAVADPFLARRIRAAVEDREYGVPDREDWVELAPLLEAYWAGAQQKVAPRHAPGRIKQWLNLLRRTYPEAERFFQLIRPARHSLEISQCMPALVGI